MRELELEAKTENLDQVLEFVNEALEQKDCPMKTQIQIDIAVEEIFVNIAHYAYNPEIGNAKIRLISKAIYLNLKSILRNYRSWGHSKVSYI